MKINADTHLTYCLNVHPGESWREQRQAVGKYATAVRDRLGCTDSFGLGLRISSRAANEALADSDGIAAFVDFMKAEGMYAFTVNAFPFGRFHGSPVKDAVYAPDWCTSERFEYTVRVADILARLLPEGVNGSISTCPLTCKGWTNWWERIEKGARRLAMAAKYLADIKERCGREIVLAIEPEPHCYPETTAELIETMLRVRESGCNALVREHNLSRASAGRILREHLGCCFDTSHQAVEFEDLKTSLDRLRAEGIAVAKIQAGAAMRVEPSDKVQARLKPFCDPVYLHQVLARASDGNIVYRGDLADISGNAASWADTEWRIHCHLPLYYGGDGEIGTTAATIDDGVFKSAFMAGCRHVEIETYTFGILPDEVRKTDVTESIAAEYRWVLDRVNPTVERHPVGVSAP